MTCLLCGAVLPPVTENSPRVVIGAAFFGACAEHFPSKALYPAAFEAKFGEFAAAAKAAARGRTRTPAQIALAQALLGGDFGERS